jgi:hypothetical protein
MERRKDRDDAATKWFFLEFLEFQFAFRTSHGQVYSSLELQSEKEIT